MYSKVVALCAFVAVAQAGLLAAPVHYSPASAVSSQNIVRHDQHQALAAPVAYHAAPVAYHAAPVAYHAAPVHYSSASAVSSQNIVRHDQSAKHVAIAAPAAVTYHAAQAPIAYHAGPATVAYHAAPALVAHHAAPVAAQHEDFDAHPKYEYNYSVADSHTGDNKSQQESRDGDVVKGSYSFHEADGSVRTVEYSADDHSGFNAVVHNTAPTAAPVHVKAVPVHVAPTYYHH